LIGLPPSLKDVDDFVADRRRDAYENLVDKLLALPHFGERWAIPWLDLARYADTNGYEKDRRRSIWKYRDWVIGALNRDMPFDQFTIEQIAGDMIPQATDDQKIATGFLRNSMFNEEGGVDQEEALYTGRRHGRGAARGAGFQAVCGSPSNCPRDRTDPTRSASDSAAFDGD
jgi:hypothetical protein